MQSIANRVEATRSTIDQTCLQCGRSHNSVQLLAVSKKKPVSDIKLAYEAGQRMFGENYIQEGIEKIQTLKSLSDIEWHLIGPIQSNKTKLVSEHFDWVQSVDREKIARRLNDQRPSGFPPLKVCVQVNLENEPTKSGISTEECDSLLEFVSQLPNLTLKGLMAIPDPAASDNQQISTLKQLNRLFEKYQTKYSDFDTLSVGMSKDMVAAIEHGSTMVRIGTALFGQRENN